jgi:hypothetical protein
MRTFFHRFGSAGKCAAIRTCTEECSGARSTPLYPVRHDVGKFRASAGYRSLPLPRFLNGKDS